MLIKDKKNGFTLIELLVVILIIAITISMISFSGAIYRSQDQELQQTAGDLKLLLDYAQQEAIVNFSEIGLQIGPNGYRFMRFQINKDNTAAAWNVINNDSVLGNYNIPSEIHLRVVSENKSKNINEPQIVLSSNGELTPFSIQLSMINQPVYYRLVGDLSGKITLIEMRKK